MRSMPAFILMTKGNVIWYILSSVCLLVVIRLGIGCYPFGYKLSSERIVAVICMDDIADIDDYKERRTGEV